MIVLVHHQEIYPEIDRRAWEARKVKSHLIILGIDPGLRATGYGVVELNGRNACCIDYGAIYNRSKSVHLAERLKKIYDEVCKVIETVNPQHLAVEDIFYHENINTAIVMGHARGVIMLAGQQQNIPIAEYAAREVKMSTVGSGAASKQQVQAMVKNVLRLPELPRPQDAADALAVALCHCHRVQFQMRKTIAR